MTAFHSACTRIFVFTLLVTLCNFGTFCHGFMNNNLSFGDKFSVSSTNSMRSFNIRMNINPQTKKSINVQSLEMSNDKFTDIDDNDDSWGEVGEDNTNNEISNKKFESNEGSRMTVTRSQEQERDLFIPIFTLVSLIGFF
eukprot:CAMPEP_0116073010 /NCGR_PEP_ID=MMETSP0322-20121206/14932_1 /TAXON_ID=163516 /ORGANISM="Leptocylindrus danicus var. apora, Strain B651" /LENGTH=139 /DNA_ID=CAMNT_0003562091 /DNA_START=50 /DNA_END=466 /DNA_ORIENTATION=+